MIPLLVGCVAEEPLRVDASPSAEVPAVLRLRVDEPGRWRVVTGGPDAPEPEPDGRMDLRGRPAGAEVRWAVTGTEAGGRERWSDWRTWTVPPVPDTFPELALEVDGDPGFRYLAATLVFAGQEGGAPVILDARGRYVWWASADEVPLTPEIRTTDAGRVLGWTEAAADRDVDAAAFVEIPLAGDERTRTRLPLGHHDAAVLPDDRLAFLSLEFQDHPLDGEVVPMAADEVRVTDLGDPTGTETTQLWSTFSDMPLDAVATCDHISRAESRFGRPGVREWTHGNSLVWVEQDDTLLVGARFTDWLYALDRGTGALRWVLNGSGTDFTGPGGEPVWRAANDTDLWSHAHLSEAWPGGAMVFDNGDHRLPRVSRALEVAWDVEARTARVVWSREQPEGRFAEALGDVRRVGDDVLISWSTLGTVEVVGRDGAVRWRLALADGMLARVVPLEDLGP